MMRVAIATTNGEKIDLHFGHAEQFYIYDLPKESASDFTPVEIRSTGGRFCGSDSNHGKNHGIREKFAALLDDCELLLCESIGYHVATDLAGRGIRACMLECDVKTALKACQSGLLDRIEIQ